MGRQSGTVEGMMIRSALMVAGDKERHLAKIPELSCDVAVLNLEDGVADKDMARRQVCQCLATQPRGSGPRRVVRINSLDTCGGEDILALNPVRPDAIRIPKVRTREQMAWVDGQVDAGIELHVSIETPEALAGIGSLRVSRRVTTVYLGLLDLLAGLRIPQAVIAPGNPLVDHLLSRYLVDSRSAGMEAVGFVYQDHRDLQGFRVWCAYLHAMGFSGMGCVAPAQVDIANQVFCPGPEELARAREILAALAAARARGQGSVLHPLYGFLDAPVERDARVILERGGLTPPFQGTKE
ncbi:MAG: aldolase/citrate lyase family protein [Magnetococcus sp. WYHC-3]